MKQLTIQARLTAWYMTGLVLMVALVASGGWFAMRASMYHAIDRDLGYRMATVAPFIQSHALNSEAQFARVFAGSSESAVVGIFVQVTDDRGAIVYQSDVLRSHHVEALPAAPADGALSIVTVGRRGWPVCMASQHLTVNGAGLDIHVVEPLRDLLESLREYSLYALLISAAALLLAAMAAYGMSRRALAPVEQIRSEAEAIDPADLTARLRVPATDDELARLARTLNAMLARIEGAFRSIERFTADASHELRAPLALMITAGDVALRRERPREELEEVLRKVTREARRMSALVETLLALARGDARERAAEHTELNLVDLLGGLCLELEATAAAKGLALEAELPERAVTVAGDAGELRRVFLILLDNALKYTEHGRVRLELTEHGAEALVAVSDTGIGMEADALPHVFERFWRADKARSRAEGGAGLGLALAVQMVQRHGGAISVESAPGKGSTFTVRLPLRA